MASELKAGACLNYVSIVVRLVTSFFLTPFVIRSLGVEEYGLFMLSNAVILWLSLSDLGMSRTVNRYVATYHARGEKEQEAHFLGQATLLFSLLGLLALLVGAVCFFYLDFFFPNLDARQQEMLEIMYLLTLGNLILSFPLRPFAAVPDAYLKFVIPGVVNLALSLLNTALKVLLLCCGFKAIGLTVLGVSMGVAGLLWGMFYTIRCLGVRVVFRRPDIPLFREMFAFSFWVFLNHLMDLFYWQAGSPILARLVGAEAVAHFTIGTFFALHFMTASTAISAVIAPRVIQMVALQASRQELTQVMIRTGRLQAVILVLLLSGFAIYGEAFIGLWVGGSIGYEAWLVWRGALIVLVALALPLTQNAGIALLQALNIHKGRAVILFYSSLFGVILGAVLSSFHGVIGMFIGTAASLLLGQGVMMNLYYHFRAGVNIPLFLRKTYVPLLLPLLLCLSVGAGLSHWGQPGSWPELLLHLLCYGGTGGLILYVFYLQPQERRYLVAPLLKPFQRL